MDSAYGGRLHTAVLIYRFVLNEMRRRMLCLSMYIYRLNVEGKNKDLPLRRLQKGLPNISGIKRCISFNLSLK